MQLVPIYDRFAPKIERVTRRQCATYEFTYLVSYHSPGGSIDQRFRVLPNYVDPCCHCYDAALQAPGSLLSYYQQVGRAGRAVDKAYGVILHGDEDAGTHQHFAGTAFPSQNDTDTILDALGDCSLSEEELEERCNVRPRHIVQV